MVEAQVVLRFASGVPLVLLGALLLSIRPRRPSQVTFGAFATVWGLRILAANLGLVLGDADAHGHLLSFSLGLTALESVLLVHFAMLVSGHRLGDLVRATYGAIALAVVAVLILDPHLLLLNPTVHPDENTAYGWLAPLLVFIPNLFAFVIAVAVLYTRMRAAPPGTLRHRFRGMVLALNLYLAYLTVNTVMWFSPIDFGALAADLTDPGPAWTGALLVAGYVVGSAALAGIAVHAVLRPPPPEGRDVILALSYVVPAMVGALEPTLFANLGLSMETWGFWRFISVGVFVYTLANYQLFDLELKMKRFAAPTVAGVLVLLGIPIMLGLAVGDFGLQAMVLIALPEIIGTGGILVFHRRVAEAMFPGVRDEPDYHHQRRLELYKVALEDHLQRGRDAGDQELASLRHRYDISQEEHNLLVWMAGRSGGRADLQRRELNPGTLVLERYRIERLLGHGTHRATYLAKDVVSRRLVAVKVVGTEVLDGAVAELLLRDARLAASIAHPNVLAIFDVAQTEDSVLIVMDYADQGNLSDRLRKRGAMDFDDALRFIEELLAALRKIHERDIVHRNLKPKNVLLDRDGSVLLADFSAAHAEQAGAADEEEDVDRHAQALFDMLYLSPEQLRGEPATARSDLYVAAALFYQAMTNRFYLPIQGKDDHQIRRLILEKEPEFHLRDEADSLLPVLRQALAKDPEARFPDADSMLRALRESAGLAPSVRDAQDAAEASVV